MQLWIEYLNILIDLDKSGYQINIFLFLNENMLWVLIRSALVRHYSLEVPRQGASIEYHNICFRGEIKKISILLD